MAGGDRPKLLPTTSYAVLGLLSFGEQSGYDLKRFADQSIRYFFWSPARSQIYAELRRLTALGYVTEREVEQERRPDKRMYRITPEGAQALQEWLEGPAVESDVRKSTALLKVFLGRFTSPETMIAQLEERQRQLQETLAQYRAIEQRIAGNEEYFFPYLTLRAGITNVQAGLQWTEEALGLLRQRQAQPEPPD